MSNIEQVQRVLNSPILRLLYDITVIISAIQTVLYMRQYSKTTRVAGPDPKISEETLRVGLVSAIGPTLGAFIVVIGLMASIGGPAVWLRPSIIGAAITELSAANIGVETCGATLGTGQYILIYLVVSWLTMALSGVGWLIFTDIATPSLETLRNKVSGGDMKWLAVSSGLRSLDIFGYLNAGEILKDTGSTLAVLAGAVSMVFLAKTVCRKYPKLMEYSLGIAMIIGTIFALGYDQLFKQTRRDDK